MRIIKIQTKYDGNIAINTNAITRIDKHAGIVYIHLPGKAIATNFSSIENAIDAIQGEERVWIW